MILELRHGLKYLDPDFVAMKPRRFCSISCASVSLRKVILRIMMSMLRLGEPLLANICRFSLSTGLK